MNLLKAGETTHFIVNYDNDVGPAALAVANAVLAICESDLAKQNVHIPSHRGGGGDPFLRPKVEVRVLNDLVNGPGFKSAQNFGYSLGRQSLILINPFSAPATQITNDYAGFLFVAEMSELAMGFYGWDAGSSQGEALSRVMAEELHPASTSNFVNQWLSWPRPRPDWMSRNETAAGAFTPKGDLDPIAYGCGMILIYFLHSQLNFSYFDIVGAGGITLLDRYRNLTKATDDPAVRVGKLLDAHFGTASVNIVSNNPFPLYEGADRKVFLASGPATAKGQLLPDAGTAHIKPFFTCPTADYPYSEVGHRVTRTITATTLGIALPSFTWHINGETVFGNRTGVTTNSVSVAVPDPQNPGHPKPQKQPFLFDYQIANQLTAAGGSSTLTITSESFGGDYSVDIGADADESSVPTTPVSATQSYTFSTRSVIYGGTYTADQERCEKAFEHSISGKLHVVQDPLGKIHNLPDPPEPGYLGTLVEAVIEIRENLTRLAAEDHAMATRIAQYAGLKTNVAAHVFLKGAHSAAPSVPSERSQ